MPKKKSAAKKTSPGRTPPAGIPTELLNFLYDLAVDLAERRKFYEDPQKYIDQKKPNLPDKEILIKDAIELKRVRDERKKKIPFKSLLKQKYGKNMPEFADTDGDFQFLK